MKYIDAGMAGMFAIGLAFGALIGVGIQSANQADGREACFKAGIVLGAADMAGHLDDEAVLANVALKKCVRADHVSAS